MRAWNGAPRAFERGLGNALDVVANKMVGKTKQHISQGTGMYKPPVDTGAMRNNVSLKGGSFGLSRTIWVNPKIDYAKYVHEGTFKMRKRPFFDITAKSEMGFMEGLFSKEIDKIVSKIFK